MSFVAKRVISSKHPSLEGHFPGNPIVPGVLLLEEVLLVLKEWLPACNVNGFRVVKFHKPVSPNCSFTIEFERSAPDQISFSCSTESQLAFSGIIII